MTLGSLTVDLGEAILFLRSDATLHLGRGIDLRVALAFLCQVIEFVFGGVGV